MADTYVNYADLAANEVEGVDYTRTAVSPAGATWSAIAIHGGGIEGGSGEMAREVAQANTTGLMKYYEFAGIKSSGNSVLHITSTNFDEPMAVALQASAERTLSFHGFEGTDFREETALGGLDTVLIDKCRRALTAAGFSVVDAPLEIGGTNPSNIANENLSGMAVQLEMSNAQRRAFFPGYTISKAVRESGQRTEAFYRYAAAIRSVFRGEGVMSLGTINVSRFASVNYATFTTHDVQVQVSTNKLATGGSHFAAILTRMQDTNNFYSARLEFTTSQGVVLSIRKRVTSTETQLVTKTMSNLTHAVDRKFSFRIRVSGSTLTAKAWLTGDPEPSEWDLTTTDPDFAGTGSVGLRGILSSANTNTLPVKMSWDNFRLNTATQFMFVDRSINGVVKSQTADTPISLAYPRSVAL